MDVVLFAELYILKGLHKFVRMFTHMNGTLKVWYESYPSPNVSIFCNDVTRVESIF